MLKEQVDSVTELVTNVQITKDVMSGKSYVKAGQAQRCSAYEVKKIINKVCYSCNKTLFFECGGELSKNGTPQNMDILLLRSWGKSRLLRSIRCYLIKVAADLIRRGGLD